MHTTKISLDSTDYQDALRIRREVFVVEQHIPEELEVDEYEKFCEHFLTKTNGVSAATGRLRVKDNLIKFERIACLKKFRGTGVGTHLMQVMLNFALEHHANFTPYMHSQLDAVPFYEKLGWITEGDIFYEADLPHRAMIYKTPI